MNIYKCSMKCTRNCKKFIKRFLSQLSKIFYIVFRSVNKKAINCRIIRKLYRSEFNKLYKGIYN